MNLKTQNPQKDAVKTFSGRAFIKNSWFEFAKRRPLSEEAPNWTLKINFSLEMGFICESR